MEAHWIVQENVRDEQGYNNFVKALDQNDIKYTVVKVVPFTHEVIPDVNPEGPVLVWGSTTLDLVAQKRGWKPGTFLNENFDQRVWTVMYGRNNMLNGDAEYYEFGLIPTFTGKRFIRPVNDMKIFAGAVIDGNELVKWQKQILALKDDFSTLTMNTWVSVSSLKDIDAEERCFVVDGKIVAVSEYRVDGRLSLWGWNDEFVWRELPVYKFAQEMVDRWQPADAFVMDIAIIGDAYYNRRYKVIEVNCINSAGFYLADMDAVVKAIKTL